MLTVHDFTHERYPDLLPDSRKVIKRRRDLPWQPRAYRYKREHPARYHGVLRYRRGKIDVIHHGYSSLSSREGCCRRDIGPHICFCWRPQGYKNFSGLAEAFASLAKADRGGCGLVCAGSPLSDAETKLLNVLGIRDSVTAVQATNAQLLWLYRHAACFVYPSALRGFGLPVLEAFGAGCPVAVSSTSCFPEVARDGAVYFDPPTPGQ